MSEPRKEKPDLPEKPGIDGARVNNVKHREELLDEAIEESFPASDAPAVTWPENNKG